MNCFMVLSLLQVRQASSSVFHNPLGVYRVRQLKNIILKHIQLLGKPRKAWHTKWTGTFHGSIQRRVYGELGHKPANENRDKSISCCFVSHAHANLMCHQDCHDEGRQHPFTLYFTLYFTLCVMVYRSCWRVLQIDYGILGLNPCTIRELSQDD